LRRYLLGYVLEVVELQEEEWPEIITFKYFIEVTLVGIGTGT
jgi:hypothetical protein